MLETERTHDLTAGLDRLLRLPLSTTERELFVSGIDLAVRLTRSTIGYLHYVNDDQSSIELGVWSTSTNDFCDVIASRHYPLEVAGLWADTFRTRSPQVCNDYAAAEGRRGLPDGHAPVLRHLGVPVVEPDIVPASPDQPVVRGRVRLLLGVGNSERPYDADDVEVAQRIADDVWLVTRRLREHRAAVQHLALMRRTSGEDGVGTWEWDPETDHVGWDAKALTMLRVRSAGRRDGWAPLLSRIDEESRETLREELSVASAPEAFLVDVRSADDVPRSLRLIGSWIARPTGHGHLLQGALIDTSRNDELRRATYRAEHDALTGLLNRDGLERELVRRAANGRHREGDGFAVLFLDLDDFKAVNDTHGHLVGDQVLTEAARRLTGCCRMSDAVARFGGDEFVVVQGGGPSDDDVAALAAKIRRAFVAPFTTDELSLPVGVSIGAAQSATSLPGVSAMIRRADTALFAAKRRGSGFVLAGSGDGAGI